MAATAGGTRFRPVWVQTSWSRPAEVFRGVVDVPVPESPLTGDLWVPGSPSGLVILACCTGACRLSSRNRQIAALLNECGFATLLLDLLAPHEALDRCGAPDAESLGGRLVAASRWAMSHPRTEGLPFGYLSGAAAASAALCAAAELGDSLGGIVSRGGSPDPTCGCLDRVMAPTLLIVGADPRGRALNEQVADRLRCQHELRELPGATHVFDEPGAPDRVAGLAAEWFTRRFAAAGAPVAARRTPARRTPAGRPACAVGVSPSPGSGVSPDDRRSDWAYIPWTRVKSKGGSRWLAS
jgi:putative phosphoribosyl transferase